MRKLHILWSSTVVVLCCGTAGASDWSAVTSSPTAWQNISVGGVEPNTTPEPPNFDGGAQPVGVKPLLNTAGLIQNTILFVAGWQVHVLPQLMCVQSGRRLLRELNSVP